MELTFFNNYFENYREINFELSLFFLQPVPALYTLALVRVSTRQFTEDPSVNAERRASSSLSCVLIKMKEILGYHIREHSRVISP